MPKRLIFVFAMWMSLPVLGAPAHNVVLVTVDGVRWQEVFRGADAGLLRNERFTPKDFKGFEAHQAVGIDTARKQLMPFFWTILVKQGSVLGDRDQSSLMRVSNPWWFSYPGYNEILTGRADPGIDSNASRPNPNVTVLEWLNRQAEFKGKVRAYGSWDAFPYIVNAKRSGVIVNAGFVPVTDEPSARESWLNDLQERLPRIWPTVRLDALTHGYAVEAMRSRQPRVLYVAYGEPDDFAHEGKYAQYLDAIHRFDGFVEDLWATIQAEPFYKDRTLLVITTDHGRGETPLETWQHHSSKRAVQGYSKDLSQYKDGITGSEQIWLAALGAGVPDRGVIRTEREREQAQVAATVLLALGFEKSTFDGAAAPALTEVVGPGAVSSASE
jgi:hypothetical protein